MSAPSVRTRGEAIAHYGLRIFVALVLVFLVAPILAVIPLSFNAESFFTYPMPGLSLRWYVEFFTDPKWTHALFMSLVVGTAVTILATSLGTLAALGLARPDVPARGFIMALLLSPLVVPVIISAVGMFKFYATWGLASSLPGVIFAHTALATPFVVITVTATLVGFDRSLMRAGASLGAEPFTVFRKIVLPLILPGVISGALFAFVTSFDEVVVVLFLGSPEQRTLPRQMFSGIRETISPTILAAATILVIVSALLLFVIELLRRRTERLRGVTPA